MWRVLQDEGIEVDSVVGCSGGSLYGSLIANNADVNMMQEQSAALWTSDIMQGYTANLKATKDGTLRFTERSGLVDDSVRSYAIECRRPGNKGCVRSTHPLFPATFRELRKFYQY
jgi:predicted acylesterase/phospholipase RssA